jgi:hypothetical protein
MGLQGIVSKAACELESARLENLNAQTAAEG